MEYFTEFLDSFLAYFTELWGSFLAYFTELWNSFLAYLNNQPPGWIYFFLFLGAFLENIVPIIPGDTLIVFGAYLAGIGLIAIWPAYFVMWIGSAVGCFAPLRHSFCKGTVVLLATKRKIFE